jgi:hypothetical protein
MKLKRLAVLLMVVAGAIITWAESDLVTLHLADVTTNASSITADTSVYVDGYVEEITIMEKTAGTTCVVVIAAMTNEASDAEHVLYTNGAFTATAKVRPRFATHTAEGATMAVTTNLYERFYLSRDRLQLRGWLANATNENITARIKICNP